MNEKYMAMYKDELKDVVEKVELSKNAEDHTEQCILRDMARDEYQHAKMFRHMLERAGALKQDEELTQLRAKAKKALEEV